MATSYEEWLQKYEETQLQNETAGGAGGGGSFFDQFAIDLGPLGVISGTATALIGGAAVYGSAKAGLIGGSGSRRR